MIQTSDYWNLIASLSTTVPLHSIVSVHAPLYMRITVWPPPATQTAFIGEAVLSHSTPHTLLSNSSKVRHPLYGLREGERGEREWERQGRNTCTGCYQAITSICRYVGLCSTTLRRVILECCEHTHTHTHTHTRGRSAFQNYHSYKKMAEQFSLWACCWCVFLTPTSCS